MKKQEYEQVSIEEIDISEGDLLLKNEKPYAEIVGISESLFFLRKIGSNSAVADPRIKKNLINEILFGSLSIVHK